MGVHQDTGGERTYEINLEYTGGRTEEGARKNQGEGKKGDNGFFVWQPGAMKGVQVL